MQLINFLLLIINTGLVVGGQTMMKYGMSRIGDFSLMPFLSFIVKIFTSPFVMGGIAFYAVSTVVWLMILSRVNLSVAYPALSLGYVFILLVSGFYLKETVTPYHIIGITFIITGIYFVYVLAPVVKI